jgi:atlastin
MASGKAVQIALTKDNKLSFNKTGLEEILRKVGNNLVSVVSVNGPMRTGKSYMLGYFLRYLSCEGKDDWFNRKLDHEFHWKNSADRQTTGITMWSEPFFVERDGQKIAVLLMDTQGCFDDKTSTHENSLIFALSCILTSVLVYNIPKQLSEDVLQFLQLFVGYAKVAMESDKSENDRFSNLIFLIRDWQFPRDYSFGYHDDTHSPTQKNYKKEKFDINEQMPDEAVVSREQILSSFRKISCCLLPYPGDDLAHYDDNNNLSTHFMNAVKEFIPTILHPSNIVVKKIGGHEFTGLDLLKFVDELDILFTKNELPPTKSVAESAAELQNVIAHSNGLNFYKSKMDKLVNNSDYISDEVLNSNHKKSLEKAVKLFREKKRLKHETLERRYHNMLIEAIDNAFIFYQQANGIRFTFYQKQNRTEQDMKQMELEIKDLRKNKLGTGENSLLSKFLGVGVGSLAGALHIALGTMTGTSRGPLAIAEAGKVALDVMNTLLQK